MPLPDTFWDDTAPPLDNIPAKTTVDIEAWEEERLEESRKLDAQSGLHAGLRALMFGSNYGSTPPPPGPRTITPRGTGGWPRGKVTNFIGGHRSGGSKMLMSPRVWADILAFAAPSHTPKSNFGASKILDEWNAWRDGKKSARQINAVTNGVPAIVNSQLPGEDAPPDFTEIPPLPSWIKDDAYIGLDFETTHGLRGKPTNIIHDSLTFEIDKPRRPNTAQSFSWPKPDKDWK